MKRLTPVLFFAALLSFVGPQRAARATQIDSASVGSHPQPKSHLDRSGRERVGKASFYANRFAGKRMADGTPMQPGSDNAASKTLPLGTTAKVTNLKTGRTAVVTIRDRGPNVPGRIVDLSPSTAKEIGLTEGGVARVAVTPIEMPPPDGPAKH